MLRSGTQFSRLGFEAIPILSISLCLNSYRRAFRMILASFAYNPIYISIFLRGCFRFAQHTRAYP